jgi:hypothetical protein
VTMNSNRFFDEETAAEHPTARAWLERIRQGQRHTFTLWRKRDGLVFKPAKIYMTFETPGGTVRENDDWDIDLEESLLRAGVRAESPENEAQRFSLLLRQAFSELEIRFGPTFFEAALLEVVRTEFSNHQPVAELLTRLPADRAWHEGRGYTDCKEALDAVFRRAAQTLTKALRYERAQAEDILAAAVAHYLDERFRVTERKLLGFA